MKGERGLPTPTIFSTTKITMIRIVEKQEYIGA
jgi:hypothetical protein